MGAGWSCFLLGTACTEPVDPKEQGKQSWWSEMTKQLDYYFVAGDNMDDVISGYRTLTGKAPIMPKWAMGFWQSVKSIIHLMKCLVH